MSEAFSSKAQVFLDKFRQPIHAFHLIGSRRQGNFKTFHSVVLTVCFESPPHNRFDIPDCWCRGPDRFNSFDVRASAGFDLAGRSRRGIIDGSRLIPLRY